MTAPAPPSPPSQSKIPAVMTTEPKSILSEKTVISIGLVLAIATTIGTAIWNTAYTNATVATLKEQQVKLEQKVDGGSNLGPTVQQHDSRLVKLEQWREEDRRDRQDEIKALTSKIDNYQNAVMLRFNDLEKQMAREEGRGARGARGMVADERMR